MRLHDAAVQLDNTKLGTWSTASAAWSTYDSSLQVCFPGRQILSMPSGLRLLSYMLRPFGTNDNGQGRLQSEDKIL